MTVSQLYLYRGYVPMDFASDEDLIVLQLDGKWRIIKDGNKWLLLHPAGLEIYWPFKDFESAVNLFGKGFPK